MADDGKFEEVGSELHSALGQHTSTMIWIAQQNGIPMDEALCVVIAVVADYARVSYGNEYLKHLCDVLMKRAEHPMPIAHFEKPRRSDA